MLSLREVQAGHDEMWDRIVLASPRGLLFHMSDWLEIVRSTQQLELVRLGVFDNAELVGVFPVFIRRHAFLTVLASPLVIEDTHYMGPVVDDAFLPEVMRLFHQYAKANWMMSYSRIVLGHDQSRGSFTELGYECINNRTHIVNLTQDEETLWKRVKPACRRQIKKADRQGVATEIVSDDRGFHSYYELVLHLYARQNRTPPSPRSFFRAVWDRFGTQGDLVWVHAKHEGNLAAGALLGLWKGNVFFIDGVSSVAHQKLGASNALHWAAIVWAKGRGYRSYDFVGSNLPRFSQFKGSFGGDLVTYLTLEQARPRWVRILRQQYATYKSLKYRLKLLTSHSGCRAEHARSN